MGFYDKMTEWGGLDVQTFRANEEVDDDVCYRLEVEYGSDDDIESLFEAFAAASNENLTALVIGPVGEDHGMWGIDKLLLQHAEGWPNLRHLFVGDITQEESEVSWIEQVNLGRVITAFPSLEHFGCRGGEGLRFRGINGTKLRSLSVESSSIAPEAVSDLMAAAARLPALQNLELYLGQSSVEPPDLDALFYEGRFPALRSLGLLNSESINEFAIYLAGAPAIDLQRLAELTIAIDPGDLASELAGLGAKVVPTTDVSLTTDLYVSGPDSWTVTEAVYFGIPLAFPSDLRRALAGEAARGPAPLLEQLTTLDLSEGRLGDEGFEALARAMLAAPSTVPRTIVAREHYGHAGWNQRFGDAGVILEESVAGPAPPDDRYIAVSE